MKKATLRQESSPNSSHSHNNTAFELVVTVNQSINKAVCITTTTQAQTDAIKTYCARFNCLFANAESHTDESFNAGFAGIVETALMIWEACEAGTVSIAYRQEAQQL